MQPAGQQHGRLDPGARHAQRMTAGREPGHEPVTGPRAEARPDVQSGRHAVQAHRGHHHRGARRQRVRRRDGGEDQVDDRPDQDHVAQRAEAGPRPGRCRSGIHNSSTAAPDDDRPGPGGQAGPPGEPLVQHVPRSTPSPASSSIESLIPYRTSPASSWTRRRGMTPRWQHWLSISSASSPGIGFYWAERTVLTAAVTAVLPSGRRGDAGTAVRTAGRRCRGRRRPP